MYLNQTTLYENMKLQSPRRQEAAGFTMGSLLKEDAKLNSTQRTWVKCGVRDAGCGEVATGNLRGKVAGKHPAFYRPLRIPHSPQISTSSSRLSPQMMLVKK